MQLFLFQIEQNNLKMVILIKSAIASEDSK